MSKGRIGKTIRITIETEGGELDSGRKFSSKFEQTASQEFALAVVAGTLHRIAAPNSLSLDLLETTPGYVDAELSENELQMLTAYRSAVAGRDDIDLEELDVVITMAPKAGNAPAARLEPFDPMAQMIAEADEIRRPAADSLTEARVETLGQAIHLLPGESIEDAVARYGTTEPGGVAHPMKPGGIGRVFTPGSVDAQYASAALAHEQQNQAKPVAPPIPDNPQA